MFQSRTLPAVLLAVPALALPAIASAGDHDPRFLGDRIVLRTLDPAAAPGSVEDLARWAGLVPRATRSLVGPGWLVVEVEPVGAEAVRAAVADLVASGLVDFAGPALRDERLPAGDGFGAPVPTLLLCGAGGDPARALAAARDLAPELDLAAGELGGIPGAIVMTTPERDGFALLDTVERLAADPRLAWIEPDWIITGRSAAAPPNDPLFADQWAHENTGQTGGVADVDLATLEAWDSTTGSVSVPVLVIDTGVELTHPDLNTAGGTDLTGDAGGGQPVNGCDNHGTWVAGCVSAIKDNGIGVVGSAPDCPVLSARALVSEVQPGFCPGSWTTQASWTVDALDWGVQQGARVTVNSNSYGFTSAAIDARYELAQSVDGLIHFASSGNGGANSVSYPSALPTVESIGALDASGLKWSQSNSGPDLALVGPGVAIETTDRAGVFGGTFDDYITINGTSFSAPLVAGVAALVRTANPSLDPGQVALFLKATADDFGPLGFDEGFGYGLPRADAAIELALGQRDALLGDVGQVSITTGGVQTLELIAPPGAAGDFYLVLGSATGTSPGFTVDGFQVDLIQDNWTSLTITDANQGLLGNTFGAFDGQGRATATISLPGGLNPFIANLALHHTFLRIDFAPFPVIATSPPAPAPLDLEL